jgi:hypothetical protein
MVQILLKDGVIGMLDQDDINNIYSDLLVLSTEIDDIKKCLNNMAMAIRPNVTNLSKQKTKRQALKDALPWE